MELISRFFVDTPSLGILDTLINVVLAGIMAYVVRVIYIKYGTSLSNRKQFSNSFYLITMCTTLIIALIQSSITLSLGLVGALSIIRFRTAIKEPQELTYVFLCVTIGLGFGANERLLTLSVGILILIVIIIVNFLRDKKEEEYYNFLIKTSKIPLDEIVDLMKDTCKHAELKRFDETPESLNVVFFTEFKTYNNLSMLTKKMKEMDEDIIINFVSTNTLG